MTYDKSKRKNEDTPPTFMYLLQTLWRYSVVVPLQGAWWLTKGSAKGAWWLTKEGAKLAWAATQWTVNAPLRVLVWIWYLIMGLPPEFETQRETNIYRMIRRRTRRRNFFMLHTLMYSLGLFVSAIAIMSIFRNSAVLGFDPFAGVTSTAAFAFTWTLVWIFHLAHKRSGDQEDVDLWAALEQDTVRQAQQAKRDTYEAYYDERLGVAHEEPNHNHSAAYYEDDGASAARPRKR